MAKLAFKRGASLVNLLTLGALALVFVFYYLAITPAKRNTLVNRDFRLLADMGDQIKDGLSTLHISVLSAAALLEQPKGEALPQGDTNPVDLFTNNIAQIAPPLQLLTLPLASHLGNAFVCTGISVEHALTQYWLTLSYTNTSATNGFAVRTDLAELLSPILGRYAFGEILLTDTNGRVLFQKSQAESRATNPKSSSDLLIQRLPISVENHGTNLSTQSSSLAELELRGEKYQVFSQPLQLSFGSHLRSDLNWLVCGLVRAREFDRQKWQVSPTLAVMFLFLAGAVLLSWPLLNVLLSHPDAGLRRAQVLWLLVGSFFTCSSLTGVLLYANAYLSAESELDNLVVDLARDVREHMTNELAQVDALLTDLDRALGAAVSSPDAWASVRQRGQIHTIFPQIATCPTLSDVCWISSNGVQVVKWGPRRRVPELLPVAGRLYFRSIREGWAWPSRTFAPSRTDFFYLEPIFSMTRNENMAVFSRLFSSSVEWRTNHASTGRVERPLVSTLIFQPLSLFDPLLPAGYGFCVIEQSGRVLFHSDNRRNLRENFILETGSNKRLQEALQSRTRDHFKGQYLDRAHHLAIEPVPDLPWTIVAFHNESIAASAHRNMVLTACILFCLYALLAFLFLVAGPMCGRRALRKKGISQSWFYFLWPTNNMNRYQAHLRVAASAAVVCLGGILYSTSENWLTFWALLGPAALVIASLFACRIKPPDRVGAPAAPFDRQDLLDDRTRRAHVCRLATGLILLAMLPSFACYKLTFLMETESLAKGTQLQLAREFQQRPIRMRMHARRPTLAVGTNYWSAARELRSTNSLSRYFQSSMPVTRLPQGQGESHAAPATPGLVNKVYRACRPLLEGSGLPTSGFLPDAADDGSWHVRKKDHKLVLTLRAGPNSDPPAVQVSSDLLTAGWMNAFSPPFRELNWRLGWYIGLFLVIALPFAFAWFIAQRIFLLHLPRYATAELDMADYKRLWHESSPNQKRQLFQIAGHGFVHPKLRNLRDLLKKGLIRFDPELNMDPAFRSYVLEEFPKDPAASSLPAQSASPLDWVSIRGAVGIAITAVAVFLFATQKELWQLVVAFTGTFAALAQQLPKAGWFFTDKPPE